jgi:hypothetical protein
LPPLPVEAAHRSRLNDASRMVRAHPSSAATAMPSARRDERAVDAASEARPNEPALDCRLACEPRAVRRRLKLGAAPFRRRRARARRSCVRAGAGRLDHGSACRRCDRVAPAESEA